MRSLHSRFVVVEAEALVQVPPMASAGHGRPDRVEPRQDVASILHGVGGAFTAGESFERPVANLAGLTSAGRFACP